MRVLPTCRQEGGAWARTTVVPSTVAARIQAVALLHIDRVYFILIDRRFCAETADSNTPDRNNHYRSATCTARLVLDWRKLGWQPMNAVNVCI
jgi:hypothetical protein